MFWLRWVQMTGRPNFLAFITCEMLCENWETPQYELTILSSSAISHWLPFTIALAIIKYNAMNTQALQTPFKSYSPDMLRLVSVFCSACIVCFVEKSLILSMFSSTLYIFASFYLCVIEHHHVWMMQYLLICVICKLIFISHHPCLVVSPSVSGWPIWTLITRSHCKSAFRIIRGSCEAHEEVVGWRRCHCQDSPSVLSSWFPASCDLPLCFQPTVTPWLCRLEPSAALCPWLPAFHLWPRVQSCQRLCILHCLTPDRTDLSSYSGLHLRHAQPRHRRWATCSCWTVALILFVLR